MSEEVNAIDKLSAEDKQEFVSNLREAVFHLASCWDALGACEGILGEEIEVDQISGLTSSIGAPEEAFRIDAQSMLEWLEVEGGESE